MCVLPLALYSQAFLFSDEEDSKPVEKKIEVVNLPTDSAGNVVFDSVIQVPGATKDVLFNNAQEWFVTAFKDSKSVIDVQDKEAGLIAGKGFIETNIWYGTLNGVEFKITMRFKDEKFKYTFSNFYHKDLDTKTYPDEGGSLSAPTPACKKYALRQKHWNEIKEIIRADIGDLAKSLIKAVSKTENTEW